MNLAFLGYYIKGEISKDKSEIVGDFWSSL
jgi:hypothetical protein